MTNLGDPTTYEGQMWGYCFESGTLRHHDSQGDNFPTGSMNQTSELCDRAIIHWWSLLVIYNLGYHDD